MNMLRNKGTIMHVAILKKEESQLIAWSPAFYKKHSEKKIYSGNMLAR